jgi:hypothetical protein
MTRETYPGPEEWRFVCDGCGKVFEARSPTEGYMRLVADAGNWMQVVEGGEQKDYCRRCMGERTADGEADKERPMDDGRETGFLSKSPLP